jgi:hypothetical protein
VAWADVIVCPCSFGPDILLLSGSFKTRLIKTSHQLLNDQIPLTTPLPVAPLDPVVTILQPARI